MKLCCSTAEKYPPRLPDVVELFMTELRQRGVDQHWFYRRREPGPARTELRCGVMVTVPRTTCLPGPLRHLNKLRYWFCDARWLLATALRIRPDAVLVRDKYLATLAGWLAARLTGARFVIWLSYPFPEHDRELAALRGGLAARLLGLRARLAAWLLYRIAMRAADHVFVQSEQMKRDVAAQGVPAAKLTAVPMGIPLAVFRELSAQPRQPVAGRVLYLGTLSRVRRLEMILRAFAIAAWQHREAELWIVGEGDRADERLALEHEAERLGLAERIRFTGFVPAERARELVRSAAVCLSPIHPSPLLNAGSPTKLVEYLALGVPVVANDHPEQSAILAESGAGLCVPWSEQAFAAAIGRLLADPAEAERMGSRGPAWVAAHRTYDRIADAVHRRLHEVVAGPQAQAAEARP